MNPRLVTQRMKERDKYWLPIQEYPLVTGDDSGVKELPAHLIDTQNTWRETAGGSSLGSPANDLGFEKPKWRSDM